MVRSPRMRPRRTLEGTGVERIILHAGTPKTGTKSLQVYLARHRDELLTRGILYPRTEAPALQPRHQWMVGALTAPKGEQFQRRLDHVLAEASSDTHTLILSTEGLYNHWWDFSKAGRKALATLRSRFQVEIWTWFRDPVAYTVGNYIEMLKSPRGYAPCYGMDISPEEMLDDPWFARHLDYIGFIRDADDLLGEGAAVPIPYVGDTIDGFVSRLGVEGLPAATINENRTMGSVGVGLIRVLNRHPLSPAVKASAVALVSELDTTVGDASRPLEFTPATRERILTLAAESLSRLERDYGITLASEGSTRTAP